jgi:ABC-type phosphate transport system auxiliary subunit
LALQKLELVDDYLVNLEKGLTSVEDELRSFRTEMRSSMLVLWSMNAALARVAQHHEPN